MEEEGQADDVVQVLAPRHPQPSEGGKPRCRFDAFLLFGYPLWLRCLPQGISLPIFEL